MADVRITHWQSHAKTSGVIPFSHCTPRELTPFEKGGRPKAGGILK
jgi:hypothetical protein